MNIGLDYRPAQKPNSRRRGVGRYTHQLARALLELESTHAFLFYSIPGSEIALRGSFRTQAVFHLRKPNRLYWLTDSFALPRRIRADGLDVFHVTDPLVVPECPQCRLVVSIHDLIPYVYWEETSARVPADFRFALKRAWRRMGRADLVVTHSEHSRRDICRMLSLAPSKVHVVPPGCTLEPVPFDRAEARLVQERYGISGCFLLYVGGSDYRKNLPRLLEAFGGIRRRGYRGQLVLAGETFEWDIPEVRELKENAERLGISGAVRFLGFVPDGELSILFSTCDFFFFPSLYEGFGLPVLEAMRCGAPLLLSRASSIPEVAGDAAFYFDPESVDAMIESFTEAVGQPELVAQKRDQARLISRRFSWQEAARRMLALYEESGGSSNQE
ncbi:MAG: glycosyltransferase family 1 protein [Acidobacteriota bacterium]